MGEVTKIQWCDHTFNPWRGCTKISDGCKHCYADAQAKRNPKTLGVWGPQGTRVVASEAMWREPEKWNAAATRDVVRRRVFCASMCDVFEDVPESAREAVAAARLRLWTLIESTPALDWLLLTKRPGNVLRMVPRAWRRCLPDNVWVGTSVESQDAAEKRIPKLLCVPAVVRFLSMEPLLGPVDVSPWVGEDSYGDAPFTRPTAEDAQPARGLQWVIVGGESGPHARPCDVAWIRSVVAECREAETPVFVKQLGRFPHRGDDGAGWAHDFFNGGDHHWRWDDTSCVVSGSVEGMPIVYEQRDPKGGDPDEWPEDLRVREVPEVWPA